jgi:hypothetical protein
MKDHIFKPVSNSLGVVFANPEHPVPAASDFIGKKFQSKKSNQIYNHSNMLNVQWPNQRLKLTEKAVSFSPRMEKIFREMAMPAARTAYTELAARRRSLAAVR